MKLKDLLKEDEHTGSSYFKLPGDDQTLEVVVEPVAGAFRALIKNVNQKAYGSDPSHPKEFMASAKTAGEALIALGKKLVEEAHFRNR